MSYSENIRYVCDIEELRMTLLIDLEKTFHPPEWGYRNKRSFLDGALRNTSMTNKGLLSEDLKGFVDKRILKKGPLWKPHQILK